MATHADCRQTQSEVGEGYLVGEASTICTITDRQLTFLGEANDETIERKRVHSEQPTELNGLSCEWT